MTEKVECPRCGQDYLLKVELVMLKRQAILCPECDALWLEVDEIGPSTKGSYGVTWFDYGTFMINGGRPASWHEDEVKVLEPLRRRPEEWENADLGGFLEAMSAWVDDMDGYYPNIGEAVPTQPEWRTLAEILAAARVYE